MVLEIDGEGQFDCITMPPEDNIDIQTLKCSLPVDTK